MRALLTQTVLASDVGVFGVEAHVGISFAASRTRASPVCSLIRLGVRREFGSCVFSLASGLPSMSAKQTATGRPETTTSAGDFSLLFGCFVVTTPLYDYPPPFMKDLWLIAFSFRQIPLSNASSAASRPPSHGSGQSGLLFLLCAALSLATPCRFIPTLSSHEWPPQEDKKVFKEG